MTSIAQSNPYQPHMQGIVTHGANMSIGNIQLAESNFIHMAHTWCCHYKYTVGRTLVLFPLRNCRRRLCQGICGSTCAFDRTVSLIQFSGQRARSASSRPPWPTPVLVDPYVPVLLIARIESDVPPAVTYDAITLDGALLERVPMLHLAFVAHTTIYCSAHFVLLWGY